jgi:hypothetical protein
MDDARGSAGNDIFYIIGFALPGRSDYEEIRAAVDRVGLAYWCLDTVCVAASKYDAIRLRGYLSQYLSHGEKMFVVECGADRAIFGYDDEFLG